MQTLGSCDLRLPNTYGRTAGILYARRGKRYAHKGAQSIHPLFLSFFHFLYIQTLYIHLMSTQLSFHVHIYAYKSTDSILLFVACFAKNSNLSQFVLCGCTSRILFNKRSTLNEILFHFVCIWFLFFFQF